jgi:hypothetical protein
MWLFRTRIFQELKGITMSENKGWSRRNGYYAGNMDPGLMNAQKNGLLIAGSSKD